MKQFLGLHLFLVLTTTLLVTLLLCQVQGGIITNQQALSLPKEIADSIGVASNTAASTDATKNETRTGRVVYTASYSNVRISSKEPKSLKFFPIPAVVSKKHVPSPTVIVPVLRSSTTEEPTTTVTTTTVPSTTTTTSSTTTTTPAPPPTTSVAAVEEQPMPDIIEIFEEMEPDNGEDDEVVTETVINGGDLDSSENEDIPVTERNVEDE